MKKSVVVAVLAFSVMSTAYASDFITAPIKDDYKLTLEGNDEGDRVGLIIKNAGVEWADVPDDSLKNNDIAFFGEYPIEDGGYSIELPLKEKSGLYSVVLGNENNIRLKDILLMYANPQENKEAMRKLISAAAVSEQEMIKTAKENRYALQFYLPLTDTVSETAAFKALYKYVGSDSVTENDGEKAADLYRRELIVSALDENKLPNLYEYFSYMNISDERIDKWYGSATEEFKSAVAARLNSASIGGAEKFKERLIEAIILQKVQKPDGYMNIMSILNDFSAETGFASNIVTTGSCSAVTGKNYTSYAELKNALSMANTSKPQTGGGGGSTSPASGSHSGSVSSFEVKPGAESMKPLDVSYFTDLDNYGWAKNAVGSLFVKGIVSGRGDGLFAPNDAVTREEFVKILVLAMDLADDAPCENFSDVDEQAWYAPYITSAVNKGVINGQGEGIFGVGQIVTRQDMAVMMYRTIVKKDAHESSSEFSDIDTVSEYAKEAVKYMNAAGILNGYEDGTFRPFNPVTRAETAVAVSRMLGN